MAMKQDELAILKLISLCRKDHSLHHPGLVGRREVDTCIASRCRERWATMSNREKAPFIHVVSVGRTEKSKVPKNILVSGEALKSKRRKKFTPRFSGYLVFSKENRRKVMDEMRAAGGLGSACIQQMMREVGRRWALLTPEEKDEYNSKARGLKREAAVVKVEESVEKAAKIAAAKVVEKILVPNEVEHSKRKKTISGYLVFCRENMSKVVEELANSGENLSTSDIQKEVGRRWAVLPSKVQTLFAADRGSIIT